MCEDRLKMPNFFRDNIRRFGGNLITQKQGAKYSRERRVFYIKQLNENKRSYNKLVANAFSLLTRLYLTIQEVIF